MNMFGSKMFLMLSVLLAVMLCFGVVSASDDIDGGAVLAVDESASFDGADSDVLDSADEDAVGGSGNESVRGAEISHVSPDGSGTGGEGDPAGDNVVDNVSFLDGEYNIAKPEGNVEIAGSGNAVLSSVNLADGDSNIYPAVVASDSKASICYVSPNGKGDGSQNNPTNWNAILTSYSNYDVLVFLSGTYYIDAELKITKSNFKIRGSGNTVFDGKNKRRILYVTAENVVVEDITFAHAYNTGWGGAVRWDGANGRLNDCNFTHNRMFRGDDGGISTAGALYWTGVNGSVLNCNFINNSAKYGGSAYSCWGGAVRWPANGGIMSHCTFDSNHADSLTFVYGGALYWNGADGKLIECSFSNNYADAGTYSYGGALRWNGADGMISGCNFTDNHAKATAYVYGTAIYWEKSGEIDNCYFANNNASSQGTIHWRNSKAVIKNSKFINNTAGTHGGAIYLFNVSSNIDNCMFADNSANLTGGSIFLYGGTNVIRNSNFTNSHAYYGGALCDIDSETQLNHLNFNNNVVSGFGGAIYKMYKKFEILNSNLINNSADSGGALYVSHPSDFIMKNDYLKDNVAHTEGGALYLFAGTLSSDNVTFVNNVSSRLNGCFSKKYIDSYVNSSNYTLVVADTSNYDGVFPSRFSLVEQGWVTPVKDQRGTELCWDFAFITAVESALLKATGVVYDFSEDNLKNIIGKFSDYGDTRYIPNNRGNIKQDIAYLGGWLGPIYEYMDPNQYWGIFSPNFDTQLFHIQNVGILQRSGPLDNDGIKEALMKYGAVKASIYMDTHNGYNYYYKGDHGTTHGVAIVGWDDNYAASNFPGSPPGDGAWIVQNSYGENWYDGYFYVSYYDSKFALSDLCYIIFNDTIRLDRNYQHDYIRYIWKTVNSPSAWYKNVYRSVDYEELAAFSSNFNSQLDWEVFVYVGNELRHSQTGSSFSSGYFTFNFDKTIPVNKGEEFSIVLKISTGKSKSYIPVNEKQYMATTTGGRGISYYSNDGKLWTDLNNNNQVACLKVFSQNGLSDSFTELNNVLSNIDENIYYLDHSFRYCEGYDDEFAEGIVLRSNIIIDGQNNIIDASNLSRFFKIGEDIVNVTIKNIKFANANSGDGGAIFNLGFLNIVNCTFVNCHSSGNGGAIYSLGAINLSDSKFINNSAVNGGAVYLGGNNVLSNLTFINNTASNGASAYLDASTSSFDAVRFKDYNGANVKGIMYLINGASLTNLCDVDFDKHSDIFRIYVEDVYYYNCTTFFVGDGKKGSGLFDDEIGTLDNAAHNIKSNGKIILTENINVDEIDLMNLNNVTIVGNGFSLNRKENTKYLFFLGNADITIVNTTMNAGTYVADGSTLNLKNISFAAADGWDITYGVGSQGSIENSYFIGTTGLVDNHIVNVNGAVDIVNCEFKDNNIFGSAVYYSSYASGSIRGSVFTGNTASSLRNLQIDSNNVVLSGNTYDVIVDDVAITNDVYGKGANVTGKIDAGVNFFTQEVTLTINDTLNTQATVTVNNYFEFTFELTNTLSAGKYNLTATVAADGNTYVISYNDNQFEIIKADAVIVDVVDLKVVYSENNTIVVVGNVVGNTEFGAVYNGTVTVVIGDDKFSACDVAEGDFRVVVPVDATLTAGDYDIVVSADETANYNSPASVTKVLNVVKAEASIVDLKDLEVGYGENNTVVVSGRVVGSEFGVNYTGYVTVNINGSTNSSYVDSEDFEVLISGMDQLDIGTYDIVVSVPDDVNYNGTTKNATIHVVCSIVDFNATVTEVIKLDQHAVVSVSLPKAATGIVNVTFNNTVYVINLTDGETSVELPIAPVGTYDVVVSYDGDDRFKPKVPSVAVLFTVIQYTASDLQKLIDDAVSNNQSEITLDHDYVFQEGDETVNIPDNLTVDGNGHTVDGNGQTCIFNVTGDNVLIKNITLTGGNGIEGGAIEWNGNNGTLENAILINNTAANGGAVNWKGDNATIKNSTFEDNTAILGAGAMLNGNEAAVVDSHFVSNKAETGAGVVLDGIDASVSNSAFVGNKATFGGGIFVGENAAGTKVDNSTKSHMKDNTGGDLIYDVAIRIDVNTTNVGDKIDIAVSLKGDGGAFTGDVTVTVDGKSYTKGVVNGVASFAVDPISKAGNYVVTAQYANDGMYINAKANATVEIVDKTSVAKIVGNGNIAAFYLETARYTVRVVDGDGKAIGGVSVKFTLKGKTYYGNTDANGYAYVTAKLAPGTYKVTAEYDGVKVTNDMVFKHIIKAKKTAKVKKSRKVTKIRIVLKGKKVFKKKKLTIKLKGKKYKVKTNRKGVAYFKVTKKIAKKLKKGKKYKYDIIFKKDKLTRYIKVK